MNVCMYVPTYVILISIFHITKENYSVFMYDIYVNRERINVYEYFLRALFFFYFKFKKKNAFTNKQKKNICIFIYQCAILFCYKRQKAIKSDNR